MKRSLLSVWPGCVLRCVYAVFHESAQSRKSPTESPILIALLLVSLLIQANVMTALILVWNGLLGGGSGWTGAPTVVVAALYLVLLGACYQLLGRKERHRAIVAEYREAAPRLQRSYRTLAWSYVAGSMILLVVSGWVILWPRAR